MKLKTVAISLPDEHERRVFIKKEIEKCNLLDYIIIDGVDGTRIIEESLIPPFISKLIYEDETKIYDSRLRLNGNGLKKGEWGCSWSHLKIYEMLLEDVEYNAYLVLEDDAECVVDQDELKTFLNELEYLNFDICHIFYSQWFEFNKIKKISDNYWIPERRFFNHTGSYIVTKTGAKKLLNAVYPCFGLPADDLMSNLYICSEDFNVIVPSKFLFKPKGFKSSIEKINKSI